MGARFYDYDDCDRIPEGLWKGATKQAFNSKHGQAILRDVEAALLALPDKRLIRDQLATDTGEVCLVGAYCAFKVEQETGASHRLAVKSLAESRGGYSGNRFGNNPDDDAADIFDTAYEGQRRGMRHVMAWELANLNDNELAMLTPEQRYDRCLEFVREHLR
jgi:hypothetical protein